MSAPATAALIASDLATVILHGTLRPGEQAPSQSRLMSLYDVAMGTAAAALAKVRAGGLIESAPGRRSTVLPRDRWDADLLALYKAAELCRREAAISYGSSAPGIVLDRVDRTVVRALGEQMFVAALRIVGHGRQAGDGRLVEAARALLRDGGRRPAQQPGIALSPRWPGEDGDAIRRLFPERTFHAELGLDREG
ncbi:MAG TPA: GntR family transcriptional regulator [Thermomonospora sp.]|nr:GntR family transcriptional regulator [Thermomonospora sp.]